LFLKHFFNTGKSGMVISALPQSLSHGIKTLCSQSGKFRKQSYILSEKSIFFFENNQILKKMTINCKNRGFTSY